MLFLAIECSSARRSVACGSTDGLVLASAHHDQGRGTPLLALTEQVLREAGANRRDVSRFVMGLGPGSYTGIRSSLALAQGWKLATGVPLQGIEASDACAQVARRQGLVGDFTVVIDAQRGEFYVAGFRIGTSGFAGLSPLRLATRAELDVLASEGASLIGPDLPLAGLNGTRILPDASALIEIAARIPPPDPAAPPLEPIYLRATSFVKAPPPRVLR